RRLEGLRQAKDGVGPTPVQLGQSDRAVGQRVTDVPGATLVPIITASPPTTRRSPKAAATWLGASTPSQSGTPNVSGPISGRMVSIAPGTCQPLRASNTTSTGPTVVESPVDSAGRTRQP